MTNQVLDGPQMMMSIAAWYMCSAISNNASKALLGEFPYPLTIAITQYVPVLIVVPLYQRICGTKPKPITNGYDKGAYELDTLEEGVTIADTGEMTTIGRRQITSTTSAAPQRQQSEEDKKQDGPGPRRAMLDGSDLKAVVVCHWEFCLYIGFASMVAHVLQRTSLLYVPVSFSHTVKACQPFFMCLISYFWMKERLPWRAYVSLIPIAFGISLATVNEIHFDILGAMAAIGSALAITVAQIASKILIKEPGMDKYNVYYLANVGSFLTITPLWLLHEGFAVLPPLLVHYHLFLLLMASSLTVALQQFLSLTILQVMSPTSHGVVNSFKRIFVITMSILVFGNEIGIWNGLGIGLSILGGYLYQRAMKIAKLNQLALHPPSKESQGA